MHHDIHYRSDNLPIPHTFSPGIYQIELWGAQGGNISDITIGGKGGYAKGVIHILSKKTFYFYIGEKGKKASNDFTENSFNGGGRGTGNINDNTFAAGGGGATDLRTNETIETRILIAGGGSGATDYANYVLNGSCGGGFSGEDGKDSIHSPSNKKGSGGTQTIGGSSYSEQGKFGYGGNQTRKMSFGSGGGGGWYGGGSGQAYGATGGGGSGYASLIFDHIVLLSGCSVIPNFYGSNPTIGHVGDGAARITRLKIGQCTSTTQSNLCFIVFVFIITFIK